VRAEGFGGEGGEGEGEGKSVKEGVEKRRRDGDMCRQRETGKEIILVEGEHGLAEGVGGRCG